MFDIGFAELLLVGVVALIVLGPERLPHALKTAGMWLGRIKRAVGSVQKEISEELRIEEMRRAAREQQQKLEKESGSLSRSFNETLRDDILRPANEPRAEEKPVAAEGQAKGESDVEQKSQS